MPVKYIRKTPVKYYAVIDNNNNTIYIGKAKDISKKYYFSINSVYACINGKFKLNGEYRIVSVSTEEYVNFLAND